MSHLNITLSGLNNNIDNFIRIWFRFCYQLGFSIKWMTIFWVSGLFGCWNDREEGGGLCLSFSCFVCWNISIIKCFGR